MIQNFISLSVNVLDPNGITIGYDNKVVSTNFKDKLLEFPVLSDAPIGNIWITGHCEILSIAMFDLGLEKLKYLGIVTDQENKKYASHIVPKNGTWSLEYSHPVFTWLHNKLQYGWLIS